MRYCEGLPEAGVRALTDRERAAVARLGASLRVRLGVRAALVVAAPLAAVALVAAFAAAAAALGLAGPDEPPGAALETVAAAAFFGGFLVAPSIALLSARDRWREWRAVRRDAAAAIAIEFGGAGRTVAVLPASERVLARDGRPCDLRARSPIAAAAPSPVAAPTYALPVDGDAPRIAEHGLVRRPLSPDEREEIRAHARALRRVPWTLAAVVAWWAFGWIQLLRGEEARRPLVLVLTLALLYAGWRVLRARALAARLEADADEGWAIRATAGERTGDEGLAASRLGWTSKGAPVPWRTARRR